MQKEFTAKVTLESSITWCRHDFESDEDWEQFLQDVQNPEILEKTVSGQIDNDTFDHSSVISEIEYEEGSTQWLAQQIGARLTNKLFHVADPLKMLRFLNETIIQAAIEAYREDKDDLEHVQIREISDIFERIQEQILAELPRNEQPQDFEEAISGNVFFELLNRLRDSKTMESESTAKSEIETYLLQQFKEFANE